MVKQFKRRKDRGLPLSSFTFRSLLLISTVANSVKSGVLVVYERKCSNETSRSFRVSDSETQLLNMVSHRTIFPLDSYEKIKRRRSHGERSLFASNSFVNGRQVMNLLSIAAGERFNQSWGIVKKKKKKKKRDGEIYDVI